MTRRSTPSPHKAIENFQIGNLVWRASPFGLIFYARKYLDAAYELVPARTQQLRAVRDDWDPVTSYLVCHSLELGLKAFLCLHGKSLLELSTLAYGHGLTLLLTEADRSGLANLVTLQESQRVAIRQASRYYEEKVFEYPSLPEAIRAYGEAPRDLGPLLDAATLLCEGLHKPCLDEANK